ncbi:hypothetical protein [Streptomyces sp. IMTB 1903]|uniref:hypothetical protein n=1 Tax=Streptomyces sp. IMTB 1903 TaxID=1776680 RepID=UPI000AD6CC17|nr:hypothetical protein [Streptomyces sp. IMTB 1903]
MKRYELTVCLPGGARDRREEAVGEAMAPFCRDREGEVPEDLRIWDDWRICGSSDSSGFRIRPGREKDPRIVHDQPLADGTVEPGRRGWCAGGPRRLLEVTERWERGAAFARLVWDGWQQVVRAHPPGRPYGYFAPKRHKDMAWSDYVALGDPAYDAYDNQPCQVAFREWAAAYETGADAAELRAVLLGDCTREDFSRRGARWTVGLCSLLTLDGWWRKDGEPPVHGACDAPGSCPHPPPVADEGGGAGRLAALPADTLLVHVRCQV